MLVGVVVGTETDAQICVEGSARAIATSQHRLATRNNSHAQPSDDNGLAINSLQVEGTGRSTTY